MKTDPIGGAVDVEADAAPERTTNKKPETKYEEEEKFEVIGVDKNHGIYHDNVILSGNISNVEKSHLSGISSVSGPDLLGGDTRDGAATPTLDRSGHDGGSFNELGNSGLLNF